jgi:opacity protein-like surface antigen
MNALALVLALALGPTDVEEDRLPRSLADSVVEPVRPPAEDKLGLWLGGHLGVAGAYDGDSPCFVVGFEGRMQILSWLAVDATIDFQSKQEVDKAPGAHFFQVPFMFSGMAYPPLNLGPLRPYGVAGVGFTITDLSGPAVKDDTSLNRLFFLGFGAEYELAANLLVDANVRFVFAQDPPNTGDFSADWAQFTVGLLFKLGK